MSDRIAFEGSMTTEGRRIRGAVTLVGSRTFRNGEWLEVDPAAVVAADASNVKALFEHDEAKVLGRTANDTLTVTRTDQGIEFETADLPNTTYANDALELVRGGYVTGSSFAIEGLRSAFSTDPDGTRVRRITSIKRLVDVSPVFDPAFVNSHAAAFSKENQMTTPAEPTAAPEPTPAPAPAPTAEPTPIAKFSANETAEATERFARTLDTAQIENAMDGILAASNGELKGINLDQYEAYAKVYGERKRVDAETRDRVERMHALHNIRLGRIPKAPAASDLYESDDYKAAFSTYLRDGNKQRMEQFAQAISGDGTQGGFTVPDGFLAKITTRLKAFGGIAGVADEVTTSTGESLRWPYLDDTSNTGAIATEGVAGTAGADLVFDSIELGAFSYDANGTGNNPLKVSLELIQDAAFDIAGLISNALGERIGRKQAVHLATGTGSNQPVGLLSKTADTMTATAVSLAGPEHIFQVDSEYRNGGDARWVMSDTTLAKLWTSQATTNEPLFQPGRTLDGKPFDAFFGYPITIDPAAGNLVAFGDIRRGYIVRRVRGVQVLVDPYTAQGTRQVAYYAWARMDANVQDANAYSVSTWASVSADT
jgi:HK97 family phage major capsid protein/HK97 family phage prohead protease